MAVEDATVGAGIEPPRANIKDEIINRIELPTNGFHPLTR